MNVHKNAQKSENIGFDFDWSPSPQRTITSKNPNPKDLNPSQYAAKLAKKAPRNLQEVASAHDIDPVNAPKNIYD